MKTAAKMLFLLAFAGVYYACSSTNATRQGVTATPSSSSGILYDTMSNSQNTRLVDRSAVDEQAAAKVRRDNAKTMGDTVANAKKTKPADKAAWDERSTNNSWAMNDTLGSEAEVLAALAAVNNNEIKASAEAQKKQISSPAKQYARMLQTHHEDNLSKTRQLGQTMNLTLDDTKYAATLTKKGDSDWLKLADLEGEEFEMAYLDAMIQGHREVLDLIDNKLMKAAKTDALINHLKETRKTVAMHLEEAKKMKEER